MRLRILMAGAAALALTAGPVLAQGAIGSGNGAGLLGGSNRGGDGAASRSDTNSRSASRDTASNRSQAGNRNKTDTGSNWHDNSFNQRDTTVGGVYADPEVTLSTNRNANDVSLRNSSSGANNASDNASNTSSDSSGSGVHVGAPVGVDPTTLGGFSGQRAGGSQYDRSRSSGRNGSAASHRASGNQAASSRMSSSTGR